MVVRMERDKGEFALVDPDQVAKFTKLGFKVCDAPDPEADAEPTLENLSLDDLKSEYQRAVEAGADLPQPGGRWGKKKYVAELEKLGAEMEAEIDEDE